MRSKLIRLLLLFALSINIAHDAIIAVNEQPIRESVSEYVLEQTKNSECGNMGELHHLFHFSAIITPIELSIHPTEHLCVIDYRSTAQPFFLSDLSIKPPIA